MQKKLTLPSGEYLVVSVKKEWIDDELPEIRGGYSTPERKRSPLISFKGKAEAIDLPNGDYEIIGLASQITEEQIKQMGFKSIEEFHSWLKANEIFLSNPIPEPECDPKGGYDDSWIDAYQEAQQNVSEEFLILKIMK